MSVQTSEPGFTLHKLKHDDFHEICGLKEEYKASMPDSDEYLEVFTPHDNRIPSRWRVGQSVVMKDGIAGTISGFAMDGDRTSPFARINGRLYHVNTLRHLTGKDILR